MLLNRNKDVLRSKKSRNWKVHKLKFQNPPSKTLKITAHYRPLEILRLKTEISYCFNFALRNNPNPISVHEQITILKRAALRSVQEKQTQIPDSSELSTYPHTHTHTNKQRALEREREITETWLWIDLLEGDWAWGWGCCWSLPSSLMADLFHFQTAAL